MKSKENLVLEVFKMVKGFKKNGKFIPTRFKKGSKIQSLILSKSEYPTVTSAKRKAKELGFKSSKVDKTANTIRLRQIPPNKCVQGQFATIPITNGVQAVICEPK